MQITLKHTNAAEFVRGAHELRSFHVTILPSRLSQKSRRIEETPRYARVSLENSRREFQIRRGC